MTDKTAELREKNALLIRSMTVLVAETDRTIDELRADNERLREALRTISAENDPDLFEVVDEAVFAIARAALPPSTPSVTVPDVESHVERMLQDPEFVDALEDAEVTEPGRPAEDVLAPYLDPTTQPVPGEGR